MRVGGGSYEPLYKVIHARDNTHHYHCPGNIGFTSSQKDKYFYCGGIKGYPTSRQGGKNETALQSVIISQMTCANLAKHRILAYIDKI